MPLDRTLPVTLALLGVLAMGACGDRSSSGGTPRVANPPTGASPEAARPPDAAPAEAADDWALLRTTLSEEALEELSGGDLLAAAAGPVPAPDAHYPVEGPHKGALFPLGVDRGYYEFSHNEHWGAVALYLYDPGMLPREFDAPPLLNVHVDDESFALEPSRESLEAVEDGGWHFEDDALLGCPDTGRFRLVVDGRTWTPPFAHIHVGHGHAHAPAEHASGPHDHAAGPHEGIVVTLGRHLAHLEVVHKPDWGILGLYLYDAAMEPRPMDDAPILNFLSDEQPVQLTAGGENWDGEADGGWHFEDDALLGETGPGRFRLLVDGRTWTPTFTYHRHGEEPGHSHAADGDGGAED